MTTTYKVLWATNSEGDITHQTYPTLEKAKTKAYKTAKKLQAPVMIAEEQDGAPVGEAIMIHPDSGKRSKQLH